MRGREEKNGEAVDGGLNRVLPQAAHVCARAKKDTACACYNGRVLWRRGSKRIYALPLKSG